MNSSRHFLVTGASGFLGSHFLAELVRRGERVRALVRTPSEHPTRDTVEQVEGELSDAESLVRAADGVTDVVHLAARVHRMDDDAADPLAEFRRVNVEGTRLLLEAAAQGGARRFLLMSSVKAMGEEQEGVFDETDECRPESPYGISKLEAERVLLEGAVERRLHSVVLRLPMVYGPGNKGNVLRLLEAARAGRRLPLGALHNRRSMVYVDNVVAAALRALDEEGSAGEIYLVADDEPYSSRELYSAICRAVGRDPLLVNVPPSLLRLAGRLGSLGERLLGRPLPINSGVVTRLTGDLVFSGDKIRSQLGYTPTVALEEGIRRTVDWYEQAGSKV